MRDGIYSYSASCARRFTSDERVQRRVDPSQSRYRRMCRRENLLPFPGIELLFLIHPLCSLASNPSQSRINAYLSRYCFEVTLSFLCLKQMFLIQDNDVPNLHLVPYPTHIFLFCNRLVCGLFNDANSLKIVHRRGHM